MSVFSTIANLDQGSCINIPFSCCPFVECNNSSVEFELPWSVLVKRWAGAATVCYRKKEDAPLVSPCHFAGGEREHDLAKPAGMIMQDSDGGATLDEIAEVFARFGLAAMLYSSARNRASEPRFRIVVPLERLVGPRRYKEVSRAIERVIRSQLSNPDWEIDQTKRHPGDLFYVAGVYEIAVADDGEVFAPVNEFRVLDGKIWDAATWIGLADALAPEPVVMPGINKMQRTEPASFDARSKWSPETHCVEKIGEYLGLTDGRQAALYGLMSSIACSAYYWRFDLSDTELAHIANDIQRRNPPHRPYPYRKLLQNAGRLIADAPAYVGRQVRWPERYDTLAEQLAAIAATRIETDDSCARLEGLTGRPFRSCGGEAATGGSN